MKITVLLMLLSFFTSFMFIGCQDSGEIVATIPSVGVHIYRYTGYYANGNKIVAGGIVLNIKEDGTLTGTWALEKTGSSGGINIGPQIGTGQLTGTIEGAKASINLNPEYVDNNVILDGEFRNGQFVGTWTNITFRGPWVHGDFEAIKVDAIAL